MPLNVTKIYSILGNQNSVIPLAFKDTFASLGMTAGSSLTGKEEGKDRFIDEFGTEIIWLGGLPAYKWIFDKAIVKTLGYDDKYDVRNLKNKEIFEKTKQYAVNDKIKAAIEKIKKNQNTYKKLGAAKFIVSTSLAIATYIGLTKLKQKYTEKQIEKQLIEEYKNSTTSKDCSKKNENAIKSEHRQSDNSPAFKSSSKLLEQLAYNPVKNMWLVDGAITFERLNDSRNTQELIGYAIKEAYALAFLYYVGGKVQDIIEKQAIKKHNRNVSLDSRIIEDSYLKSKFEDNSIQKSLESFNNIKRDADGKINAVELYDFLHNNPENAIVKIAKKTGIIKNYEKTNKIDSRKYIDLDEVEKIHENVTQLYGQYQSELKKGTSSNKFFDDLKRIKRKSIRTNIFVSVFALGVLTPATMLLKRKFFDKDTEFETKKI